MPGHLAAACPNHVWALDFLSDQTADGRPIKILTVTDEHTREALATPAARRIGADDTVSTLEQIVQRRGTAPQLIRCDNGPELVAHALQDWCRFTGATTSYIEPGAPRQNPYIESFNGHLRRELLDLESFNTLYEAQILAPRVQPLPTPPIPELPNPHRIRPPLQDGKPTRTLITTRPKNGVRSRQTNQPSACSLHVAGFCYPLGLEPAFAVPASRTGAKKLSALASTQVA
jgi:putative transposase